MNKHVALLSAWLPLAVVACSGADGENGLALPTGAAPTISAPNESGAVTQPMPGEPGAGTPAPVATEPGRTAEVPFAESACAVTRAPLRRLTPFDYNNTVRDVLGDTSFPGDALPADVSGNGFGNDANQLSTTTNLVQSYADVAEGIAERATAADAFANLDPCVAGVVEATEAACARSIIAGLAPKLFRRPVAEEELSELLGLQAATRADGSFAESIASTISAMLQLPDFLYRIEVGEVSPLDPAVRRPTSVEMASRLSYFLWASSPDDELMAAADAGTLTTKEGVLEQATRMLEHPNARRVVEFFFDNYLRISSLDHLERNFELFPTFDRLVGALMRLETQTFLEHIIFEQDGSWADAYTADYTFMNEQLAAFYGVPGVVGEEFQQVPLDTTQRRGFLTHAGIMAGTVHTNETNPVVRGAFVVNNLMCRNIPLPPPELLDNAQAPEEYDGATARERFLQHSTDPACAGCHQFIDPVGFALENFDPIGLWRDDEHGAPIDASGSMFGLDDFNGPVELVEALAGNEDIQKCFAQNWANYGFGLTVGSEDACVQDSLFETFAASGYNVKQLLLALVQSDQFLYLPAAQ